MGYIPSLLGGPAIALGAKIFAAAAAGVAMALVAVEAAGSAGILLSLDNVTILAVILDPIEAIIFGKVGGMDWTSSLFLVGELRGHELGSIR